MKKEPKFIEISQFNKQINISQKFKITKQQLIIILHWELKVLPTNLA